MLTRCHHWDLGASAPPFAELTQKLQEMKHTEAILVSCKTSFPKEWDQGIHCTVLWGPSRYSRLYALHPLPQGQALRQETLHQIWLDQFQNLKKLAESGEDTKSRSEHLIFAIEQRLLQEEKGIHAPAAGALGLERPARELGYEHQGIRRFLPGLTTVLEQQRLRDPQARPNWSKLSLDLIHLLEHHAEHEQGIFMVYEAFCL